MWHVCEVFREWRVLAIFVAAPLAVRYEIINDFVKTTLTNASRYDPPSRRPDKTSLVRRARLHGSVDRGSHRLGKRNRGVSCASARRSSVSFAMATDRRETGTRSTSG